MKRGSSGCVRAMVSSNTLAKNKKRKASAGKTDGENDV